MIGYIRLCLAFQNEWSSLCSEFSRRGDCPCGCMASVLLGSLLQFVAFCCRNELFGHSSLRFFGVSLWIVLNDYHLLSLNITKKNSFEREVKTAAHSQSASEIRASGLESRRG